MNLLLDTNALIRMAFEPERISAGTRELLADHNNQISYSVTALWEIVIKNGTRRSLRIDPRSFHRLLQEAEFEELPITAEHTIAVSQLPRLHGDPFDRILIAQAIVERKVLVTSDRMILEYPSVSVLAL